MNNPRRRFLRTLGSAGLGTAGLTAALSASTETADPTVKEQEPSVLPTEELMMEHGVVHRLLLVYDETASRLEAGKDLPPEVDDSAQVVDEFIESYHEELEEKLVFPVLTGAGMHKHTISELKKQHDRGRDIAANIYYLMGSGGDMEPSSRRELITACRTYSRMYRAHAAWEDTVVMPTLRQAAGDARFMELGQEFATIREDTLGGEGLSTPIKALARIEEALGIGRLSDYTPSAQ